MEVFFMVKKLRRFYFLLLILILTIAAGYGTFMYQNDKLAEKAMEQAVSLPANAKTLTAERKKQKVYASGTPIGIYIKTKGVLVLGTQEIKGADNQVYSPAKNKLESGDYILKMNDEEITSKKQFLSLIEENGNTEVVLTILRKKSQIEVKLQPVFSKENQCYQIGAWIRNDTQGIGTVTYIREDGSFAALGHGINDSDLGIQLNISGGSVYQTSISTIMKGQAENPGELIGTINYIPENYLGLINSNTKSGIFGKLENKKADFQLGELMEVAGKSQIKTGKAYVRTSISGKSKDYTIEIEKITQNKKDSLKSLTIKVTDQELLALTGGIVQGLSGSPIIQDNKLVGAVTHVFVNDPTRGYGILAETMVMEE